MIKKILPALVVSLLVAGCDGPVVKVPAAPSPTPAPATTTQQPPTATGEAPSVLIVTAPEWQVNEARGWNGTLVRRGDSNVFDLHHTNSDNGDVEDRVVTVTVVGHTKAGFYLGDPNTAKINWKSDTWLREAADEFIAISPPAPREKPPMRVIKK